MFKRLLALGMLGLLAGCSANASINPNTTTDRTQRAAFAASVQYPKDMRPTTDVPLTVTVDRRSNDIRLINASDRTLRDADVWINGSYVAKVDVVPAHGTVDLRRSEFFDSLGNSLGDQSTVVSRVELKSGDRLYAVQGPAFH